MEHKTILYSSSLSYMIAALSRRKRAVGYKYDTEASILKRLDNLLIQKGFTGEILTKGNGFALDTKKVAEADSTRNARISLIKGLAQYMNKLGNGSYIYPEKATSIVRYRYNAYIFSENELARLFDAATSSPQVLFHLTDGTFFHYYSECCMDAV